MQGIVPHEFVEELVVDVVEHGEEAAQQTGLQVDHTTEQGQQNPGIAKHITF